MNTPNVSEALLKIAGYPMGKTVRSYIMLPEQYYSGDQVLDISSQLRLNFIDFFSHFCEQTNPTSSAQLTQLVDELVAMDLPQLSIKIYESHLALWDETDFQGIFALGIAHMLMGEHVRALEFFASAQKILPEEPAPYVNAALITMQQNNFEAALAWCDAGLKVDKNNFRLWQIYAEITFSENTAEFLDHIKTKSEGLDSWMGLSLWMSQNEHLNNQERVFVFKQLFDSGELDPAFLVEYSAVLGAASEYAEIPALIWRAKSAGKQLPWQLHLHCAQAYLGMNQAENARAQIILAGQIPDLPDSAKTVIAELNNEIETLLKSNSEIEQHPI
ncbi:MAG: hypothetical protein KBD78_01565 [Oligoflexales bacterium]|nr:hypothetical protein [Oligoflexales bacterium]